MRRMVIVVGLIWAASLGAFLLKAETQTATPIDPGAIFGADTGWCRETGACNAFVATCNSNASCKVAGDKCGVTRRATSPESCDTSYGNQYCNTGGTVEVICAKEWDCVCLSIPPEEGSTEYTLGCVGGNTGAGPGIDVAGTISTDALNCAYQPKP